MHFSGFILRNEKEVSENQETPRLFLNTRDTNPFSFAVGEGK